MAVRVRELIERDETPDAADWRDAFKRMDDKKIKIRKLIKQPAMTFAYGANGPPVGQAIREEYKEIFSPARTMCRTVSTSPRRFARQRMSYCLGH